MNKERYNRAKRIQDSIRGYKAQIRSLEMVLDYHSQLIVNLISPRSGDIVETAQISPFSSNIREGVLKDIEYSRGQVRELEEEFDRL